MKPWEVFGGAQSEAIAPQMPVEGRKPWEVFGGGDTAPAEATPLDFNRPIEDVRADIDKLQGSAREKALKDWADAYVLKERGGKKPREKVPGEDKWGLAKTFQAALDYVNPIGPLMREGRKIGAGVVNAATDGAKGAPYDGALIRNVARGTLVGSFADEANAATAAAAHKITGGKIGAPYDEALAYQRAVDRYNDAADPMGSIQSQLIGGFATGAPIANHLMKSAPTFMGKTAMGAGVGAVHGGVAGFGNDESGDRLANAGRGAALGTVIGAAVPSVAQSVVYGANKLADAVNPTLARYRNGSEAAADLILGQRIRSSGKTVQNVADELDAGQAARQMGSNSYAQLPETIADTSNTMQRTTGSVYRAGGEAGDIVKGNLSARQRGPRNPYAPQKDEPEGQYARVMDAVDRSMGISTAKGAHKTEQGLVTNMRNEAASNYKAAEEAQEAFDLQPAFDAMAFKIQQYPGPMRSMLSKALGLFVNPTNAGANVAIARIQKGMDMLENATDEAAHKAAQAMVKSGYDTLGKLQKTNAPFAVNDIKRFDYGKRALDDMIDAAEGNAKRELIDFKNSLLGLVHGVNEKGEATKNLMYKAARDAFADGKRGQEAIQLGRDSLNMNIDEFRDKYAALDNAQKKMVRIGVRDAIQNALAETKPGNDTTLFFQKKKVVDLLQEVIPGRALPERFGEYMAREQRMAQTNQTVLGNSATAERVGDDAQFAGNIISEMWSKFKNAPSIKGALIESIGYGMQQMFGFRQDVAKAMAVRLLETDPARQKQILTAIEKRMGPDRMAEFTDLLNRVAFDAEKTFSVQATKPSVLGIPAR